MIIIRDITQSSDERERERVDDKMEMMNTDQYIH